MLCETLYEALFDALCACFGLSPASDEASALIRRQYPEPEPPPRPPRIEDVIYYSLAPDPSAREAPPAFHGENPAAASHTPAVSVFSAWLLTVVCYGPSARENARKIRVFLFLDGAGFPLSILRKAGIYPVPGAPEPALLHEPEGSLWRRRADLAVHLRVNETDLHPSRRNAVRFPPAVTVHTERR